VSDADYQRTYAQTSRERQCEYNDEREAQRKWSGFLDYRHRFVLARKAQHHLAQPVGVEGRPDWGYSRSGCSCTSCRLYSPHRYVGTTLATLVSLARVA